MLDLTQRTLPNTITVDGRDFLINTDFRAWIRFERDIKTGIPFDCAYVFLGEHPLHLNLAALMPFARPQNELPRKINHNHDDVISLDYDIDADYIYSAFMEQYRIDLIDVEYMHWWKFLALLGGLNDRVTLSKIMMYRNYDKNAQTKNRDYYEERRKAWEILPPVTAEEQAEIDAFESQFV